MEPKSSLSSKLTGEIDKYKNAIQNIGNISFEINSMVSLPKFFFMSYRQRYEDYALNYDETNQSMSFIYTKKIDEFYEYVKANISKLNRNPPIKLKQHSHVYLTGYEGSGKSTCLEVCAARLKVEQIKSLSNVRILYIHDTEQYIKQTKYGAIKSFLMELLLTFDQDEEYKFKLESIARNGFPIKEFDKFLFDLEEYIKENNLIFISIWDQVNSCYERNGELKPQARFQSTENQIYLQPAFYHYDGLFSNMRNQINICGASFNNSAEASRFSDLENVNHSWFHYFFLNSFDCFTEKQTLLKYFTPFKILFDEKENIKYNINKIVAMISQWTNMMPLMLSILSEKIKIKLETINNLYEFEELFKSFIENQKKAIKESHLKFIQETMIYESNDLKKYIMYMMMDLPVLKSSIMPRFLDKKYMCLIEINQNDSNICKIVPINYLALKALDEFYSNDELFFTSTYINKLLVQYEKFNSDSSSFGHSIESLVRFYFKSSHFAPLYFKTHDITYIQFTKDKFEYFTYNDFKFINGLNLLIPESGFNLKSFDFITLEINDDVEKPSKLLTYIQCSTSRYFYTHMINSMDIFSKNIEKFKRLFDFNDDDFGKNIKFQWILDGSQIEDIVKKQDEIKTLDKNEINNQIKSLNEKKKQITEKKRITELEKKCLFFKYVNHQYQSFDNIGNIFDSYLLQNYSNFKIKKII